MTILKQVPEVKASAGTFTKFASLKKGATSILSSEDGSDSDKDSSDSTLRSDDTETEGESSSEIQSDHKSSSHKGYEDKSHLKSKSTSGHEETLKKLRRQRPWTICLTHCRYDIVKNTAKRYGLVEVNEDEPWNIYWTDFSVSIERAMDMRRFQIINHFPGMNEICRKDLLARNLNRMKRLFGKEYDIYPKTWSLPADLAELQNYALCRRNKIYICKPEMGCQGRGIFLIRNIKDLNPFGKIVCQLYLAKPFLIDSYKFDLRLYALITSCDPLRVYLYKEGLARFATARYKPPNNNNNTENSYMHLTNYAVNKFSRDYIVDDESGSKRRLTSVWKWLSDHGHDVEQIRGQIDDVIIKTILSAESNLRQNYNYCFPDRSNASACFEILGFDIIFDHKLKPYVLEVNHSPSFHTDAKLDLEIKEGLVDATFAMLNFKQLNPASALRPKEKKIQDPVKYARSKLERAMIHDSSTQAQYELDNCGGYRLIYPTEETFAKYEKFLENRWNTMVQGRAPTSAINASKNTPAESKPKPIAEEVLEKAVNSEEALLKELGSKGIDECKGDCQTELLPTIPTTKQKKNATNKLQLESFALNFIKPEEELERTKTIMQRGMLIRSLGIEIQVYKLLRDMGGIKAEEEKLYQRLYGHCCKFPQE